MPESSDNDSLSDFLYSDKLVGEKRSFAQALGVEEEMGFKFEEINS